MNDYTSEEIRLANELASTLKDYDALPYYLLCARKYQESFLRKKLSHVMSLDERQIKKSRGALFTFLINQASNNGNPRR